MRTHAHPFSRILHKMRTHTHHVIPILPNRRGEMAADGDVGKGGGRRRAACREVSIRSESESASFEQVFWRAEKYTG
jgi:hypothetical protein